MTTNAKIVAGLVLVLLVIGVIYVLVPPAKTADTTGVQTTSNGGVSAGSLKTAEMLPTTGPADPTTNPSDLASGVLPPSILPTGPVVGGPVVGGPVVSGPMGETNSGGPSMGGPSTAGPMSTGPLSTGPLSTGPLSTGPGRAFPAGGTPVSGSAAWDSLLKGSGTLNSGSNGLNSAGPSLGGPSLGGPSLGGSAPVDGGLGSDPSGASSSYTVTRGDTFSSIASKIYGDANFWPHIQRANPNANSSRLRVGQVLKVPDAAAVKGSPSGSSSSAPREGTPPTGGSTFGGPMTGEPTQPRESTVSGSALVMDPTREYQIRPNDSLDKISRRLYGSSRHVNAIYELNRDAIGPDMGRLRVRTVLKLPMPPTEKGVIPTVR